MTRSKRSNGGLVLTFASAVALAACSGFSGDGGGNGGAGDDADAAGDGEIGAVPPPGSGQDAGRADAADAADATLPVDADAAPDAAPDAAEAAPACDPTSLPASDPCVIADAYGVFVSSSLGSAAGAGTQARPFNTIAAAIPIAAAAKKRVYVCAEPFGEAISPASDTAIFGYFDCAGGHWSAGPHHAIINAPTSPGITINGVSNVHLEGLDVSVPSQASAASASNFGAIAFGSSKIAFVDVSIHAAEAGDGVAGGAGAALGGTGPCSADDGAPATARVDGQAGTASYGPQGYAPAKGTDGTAGAFGHAGTGGGTGNCHGGGACKLTSPPPACLGTINVCGEPGKNGCGGPGGAPGLGGTGGGSSVALFVWQSSVTIHGGALTAGKAGNGGAGGNGSAAPSTWPNQSGSAGAGASWSGGCTSIAIPCTGSSASGAVSGGTAGGAGGQGAPGGYGAGGSGGDSYAYYAGGGATVSIGASTQLTQGAAGTGGQGTVPGKNGYSAATNTAN